MITHQTPTIIITTNNTLYTHTLYPHFNHTHASYTHTLYTHKKHTQVCLIMDEVDGMSGSDRGGVQDLIQTIQKSKIPIICICNDKYNMKLRSLRNHTLELDFRYDAGCGVWCVVYGVCQLTFGMMLGVSCSVCQITLWCVSNDIVDNDITTSLSHTHTPTTPTQQHPHNNTPPLHTHRRPTKQQIVKRTHEIARKEGLVMTDATMDALVEGANADIRLILGQMQVCFCGCLCVCILIRRG